MLIVWVNVAGRYQKAYFPRLTDGVQVPSSGVWPPRLLLNWTQFGKCADLEATARDYTVATVARSKLLKKCFGLVRFFFKKWHHHFFASSERLRHDEICGVYACMMNTVVSNTHTRDTTKSVVLPANQVVLSMVIYRGLWSATISGVVQSTSISTR